MPTALLRLRLYLGLVCVLWTTTTTYAVRDTAYYYYLYFSWSISLRNSSSLLINFNSLPRRTSQTSTVKMCFARTCGDMSMGRNLWAATTLDNTNKDDDDGLCRPSYNAPAKKGEIPDEENNNNGPSLKPRTQALGTSTSHIHRRPSGSVKRPLDQVLPCQEIQYLDISYQKVGTVMVQFSPIPRKKIAYHPVLHHSIHYCDVPYCPVFDKPIKRKMLQRSKSHAGTELRERSDADWTSPYKFR